MPDISMCQNNTCELREKCYRFKAKPNEYRQAYANFTPKVDNGKTTCDHFMKIYQSYYK